MATAVRIRNVALELQRIQADKVLSLLRTHQVSLRSLSTCYRMRCVLLKRRDSFYSRGCSFTVSLFSPVVALTPKVAYIDNICSFKKLNCVEAYSVRRV